MATAATANIYRYPNAYPYTPTDDDVLSAIPYLVSRRVTAYNDESGSNVDLTVSATRDVAVEAASNVAVYIGSNVGAFKLFETGLSNNTRVDKELMNVVNASDRTLIQSTQAVSIQAGDTQNTAYITGLTIRSSNNSQFIDTSQANGFVFGKTLQVSGNTFTSGNNITMGNIYGNNINVWADKETGGYNRVGYGLRINAQDQLEIVKYTRATSDGRSITKKVAVFGTNTSASYTSDTSYLVFDGITGVTLSNNGGAASNYVSQGIGVQYVGLTNQGSNLTFTTDSSLTSGKLNVGFSNVDTLPFKVCVNGEIYAQSDIIAFSDRRVKTNLQVIPDALSKVKSLNGYTFERSDMPEEKRRFAGVIAQEVLAVLPEVVHETTDGFYNVAYGNLASLLIEAIKELSAKVDNLVGA